MTTYVSCHGSLHSSRPETFVPKYIPAVQYYAKADENLRQANELGLLARADLGLGAPQDSYEAGSYIPNYVLSPDSSEDAALATYFEPSSGSLFLLSAQTALCMFDGKDEATGQFQECDYDEGIHYCTGLFGKPAWADTRLQDTIVMLACRGIMGRTNSQTRETSADPNDTFLADAVSDFTERWNATDDEGKAAIWDDPELPEGTRVTMLTQRPVRSWVRTRQARGLIASDGDLAVLGYYLGSEQAGDRASFDADPDISAAVARARQQILDFVADTADGQANRWLALNPAERQHMAGCDATVATWAAANSDRVALLGGTGTVADDPIAPLAERIRGESVQLATSVVDLTGTDSDADLVAGLADAMNTFIGDVATLSGLAAGHTIEPTVAGLYSQGADAAAKLELYRQAIDLDNLVALQESLAIVGQWASGLSGATAD